MNARLVLPALLLLAVFVQAPPGAIGGPASHRVLYPPAGAVLTAGPVLVMILGPDATEPPAFRLDGTPLAVEKVTFAKAWKMVPSKILVSVGDDELPLRSPLLEDKTGKVIWATAVELPPGGHAVTLDGAILATFSSRGSEDDDAGSWDEPVLRVHGSPARPAEAMDCTQCHVTEAEGDTRVLGLAPVPETCLSCHAEVDLSLAHEHVMEFLAKCQTCHDPHAATRPSLLVDTRERVCALCHEAGHSR